MNDHPGRRPTRQPGNPLHELSISHSILRKTMTNLGSKLLYTEKEAAILLGIKERSLRTERMARRIGFKRVAGKIMYRHRDLVDWIERGEEPCQDETADRTSFSSRPVGATTSPTPSTDEASDAQRIRTITSKLKRRSPSSSPSGHVTGGRVIPAKSRS